MVAELVVWMADEMADEMAASKVVVLENMLAKMMDRKLVGNSADLMELQLAMVVVVKMAQTWEMKMVEWMVAQLEY